MDGSAALAGTAVIGAGGTMGVGIVYVLATHGYRVHAVEPDDDRAAAMRATLARVAAEGERRGRLQPADVERLAGAVERVRSVDDIPQGIALVVESVPESPDLKRRVLVQAESRSPTVLASNTSTLSVDDLARGLQRPQHFLGLHFFNPVWSLPLVEVVRGSATDDATLDRALAVVAAIGKQAAVIRDHPGFATSRLDTLNALEAMRMVEQGVGSPADIDRAVRLAYRHPVGPLQLSDLVGLDVRLDTARSLAHSLGPRFAPPAVLVDLVAQGRTGAKSGRGFYVWRDGRIVDD